HRLSPAGGAPRTRPAGARGAEGEGAARGRSCEPRGARVARRRPRGERHDPCSTPGGRRALASPRGSTTATGKQPRVWSMASTIRDLMSKQLVTLEGSVPIAEAARQMFAADIGAVLVEDNGKVSGIVTDRDIV